MAQEARVCVACICVWYRGLGGRGRPRAKVKLEKCVHITKPRRTGSSKAVLESRDLAVNEVKEEEG